MGIIVLLAFLFVASPALGYQCEPMRLDQPGGPLEHIPVMDQGKGVNICYAIIASQMVDAIRFSDGDRNHNHLTSLLAAFNRKLADWLTIPSCPTIAAGAKLRYNSSCNINPSAKGGRSIHPLVKRVY